MRLALDCNQFNYLVDGSGRGLDLVRLRRAARAGRVEVVGSVDLLEEILATGPWDWDKCEAMTSLFFELTGSRLLRPLVERQALEVRHEGLLPVRRRYVPASVRSGLQELARDPSLVAKVADDLAAEKQRFQSSQLAMRQAVVDALAAEGDRPTRATFRRWFETVDYSEWVYNAIAEGVERGLHGVPPNEPADFRRYPSTWMFMTYQMARVVFTVGEGRKILGSDLADAHHVAGAPYNDTLVTDDKAFHDAVAIMPVRPTAMTSSNALLMLDVAGS